MTAPALRDCWNRIGVRGDGSCAELERHVHCRNCPVYSAAASAVLDGELPDDLLAQWTAHVAQAPQVVERDTHSAVIFRIGAEWLGLPTEAFQEIGAPRPIHSLPGRNGAVLGLVNVRGELVVCISLQKLLGLGERAPDVKRSAAQGQRLLVIRGDGGRAACPADEVFGIHRFHPRELKPLPATVAGAQAKYSSGLLTWQQKSVGVLDVGLLFFTLNRRLASAPT